MSAVEPGLPEDGARLHTTVASTNGSPRRESADAELEDVRPHALPCASWIACHTFAEVSGMSMFFTPSGCRASITAFT